MLDAFKRMMGLDAEFRGVQFAILQALMQGHKNVLGIMPTGGGKSLTFMLLARCSPGGVTIVDAAQPPEWASIVFVTLEAAVGQAFKRFIQQKKLIATLPPQNELEFYDRMGINKHEIVKFQDSTTRKEIKYQVINYEKEEEEEALQRMVDDKKRQYPGK
ncbi:hypothetical protein D6C81_10675 [Aureobasidium pullulans]|nr:hypothetical protein D6C81_10675 [Aureobasidium pullulans]